MAENILKNPIPESTGYGGRNTPEYDIIQTNFHRITTSLEQEGVLPKVAASLFQKKRITLECLRKYNESKSPMDFMIEVMTKIELDEGAFYVFTASLSAIPSLVGLANELDSKAKSRQKSGDNLSVSQDNSEEKLSSKTSKPATLKNVTELQDSFGDLNVSSEFSPLRPTTTTRNLPSDCVYNAQGGIVAPNQGKAETFDQSNPENIDADEGLYMKPVPPDSKNSSKHTLIVSGTSKQCGAFGVQQELHDYQTRLSMVEKELGQINQKTEDKRNTASIRRASSLDFSLQLVRQRESLKFHRERVASFEKRLSKLEAECGEMQTKLEAEMEKQLLPSKEQEMQAVGNKLDAKVERRLQLAKEESLQEIQVMGDKLDAKVERQLKLAKEESLQEFRAMGERIFKQLKEEILQAKQKMGEDLLIESLISGVDELNEAEEVEIIKRYY